MGNFRTNRHILRIFITVPILTASVNFSTLRTFNYITGPCIFRQSIPTIVILCLSSTGHYNFVSISMALFTYIYYIFILMLIPTSEKIKFCLSISKLINFLFSLVFLLPSITYMRFSFSKMTHTILTSAPAAETLDRTSEILIGKKNTGNILNFS